MSISKKILLIIDPTFFTMENLIIKNTRFLMFLYIFDYIGRNNLSFL
jgi:hypothetical protein